MCCYSFPSLLIDVSIFVFCFKCGSAFCELSKIVVHSATDRFASMIYVSSFAINLHVCQAGNKVSGSSKLLRNDEISTFVYVAEFDSYTCGSHTFRETPHRVKYIWNRQLASLVYESPLAIFANRSQPFVKSTGFFKLKWDCSIAASIDITDVSSTIPRVR
ncbi:MAG: hypothetical protein BWY75_02432 [bacterium ADurb.Bin425]|nr:MAG: hypothetical protein BWY75_02432 [bacterium ADurb.Bin425]